MLLLAREDCCRDRESDLRKKKPSDHRAEETRATLKYHGQYKRFLKEYTQHSGMLPLPVPDSQNVGQAEMDRDQYCD